MRMHPYPKHIRETVMTRVRAGETKRSVIRSMHLDEESITRDLRQEYPDFDDIMQAHRRHQKGSLGRISAGGPAPRAKHRPHREFGFKDQRADARLRKERETHEAIMGVRQRLVRTMADFSAAELRELEHKVRMWVRDRTCRVGSS